MSTFGPETVYAQKAEEAVFSDFARLSIGDAITIFLGNPHHDRIEWLHNRVERDLIFGTPSFGSGLTLPVDCYLENTGFGLVFDTSNTKASKEGLFEDVSGTVFLSAPLPSQLPTRWKPSEKGPRYGNFAGREKKAVEAFVDDLKRKGFSEGPSWRSSGFDTRLPIWETSWQLQSCDFNLFLRQEPQGLFKPTKFFVSVTDHSHRPIWKRGTSVLAKDGLSLAEAVEAMATGVDIAWSKSR